VLSADLAERRFTRALRALDPAAVVLCGSQARLDVLGQHLGRVLRDGRPTRIYGFRAARLVSGSRGTRSLGETPAEATAELLAELEPAPPALRALE
jgi:hypothetical protein